MNKQRKKPMEILIAPSMLASDFTRMGEEACRCARAGADWLHLDVMDGHFVPNLTFGDGIIAALRRCTDLFFDVHLMIEHPENAIQQYLNAGADLITLHLEAVNKTTLPATLNFIHAQGKQAALALKPDTPASAAVPFLNLVDMLLVMTVEPGFGGQKFQESQLEKIRALRHAAKGRPLRIQVDGGITTETLPLVAGAGADCAVAGSALFHAQNLKEAIQGLRDAVCHI